MPAVLHIESVALVQVTSLNISRCSDKLLFAFRRFLLADGIRGVRSLEFPGDQVEAGAPWEGLAGRSWAGVGGPWSNKHSGPESGLEG